MEPYFETELGKLYNGDVLEILWQLPDESVQCCITSPPYWGLRDYGTAKWEGGDPNCDHRGERLISDKSTLAGYTSENIKLRTFGMPYKNICKKCGAVRIDRQLGLEKTPEEYIEKMVEVFREVRRVLKSDGTLWLNMGDCYLSQKGKGFNGQKRLDESNRNIATKRPEWLKPTLQDDGWYLRSDIIWHKPNPMPESVTDRPTKAHEYVFLMTKSAKYYYDADAIREKHKEPNRGKGEKDKVNWNTGGIIGRGRTGKYTDGIREYNPLGRNKRTVWTISTQSFPEAHFATFGSGTVAVVCERYNRGWIGIELSREYCDIAVKRIKKESIQYRLELV